MHPPPPGQWPQPPAPWRPATDARSTTRAVLIALAIAVVGFVGFVGLLIGAVTFLGTSSEQRFTPVETVPVTEPSEAQLALDSIGDELIELGWRTTDPRLAFAAGASCAPDGWHEEAVEEVHAGFGTERTVVVVTVTRYESVEAAQADVDRSLSQEYRDCEEAQRREDTGRDVQAEVTALPDDPQAPGTGYVVEEVAADPQAGYDFNVRVETLVAHVEVCWCAGLDRERARDHARAAAVRLAREQGMLPPR